MTFSEFKQNYKNLVTDEDRIEFISNRICTLIDNSNNVEQIGNRICGSYKDFVSPNTGLKSNGSNIYPNLVFDDNTIYLDFMNWINNDVDNYLYGEPSTIDCIQHFIHNYFGYNTLGVDAREEFYAESFGQDTISVVSLRGKSIAACSERSVLAHNLMKFMGFDSEIIFGKMNGVSHAYVVFKPENQDIRILYDPMNPVCYEKNDKKLYCPGLSKMTQEDYTNLMSGSTYKFDYSTVDRLFIHGNKFDGRERLYLSDSYKYVNNDVLNSNEVKGKL